MLYSDHFLALTDLAVNDVKMDDGVENVQQSLLLAVVALAAEGLCPHGCEVGFVTLGGVVVEDVGA